MTTTISLAARDFIVVGCDSLATTSVDLVFPHELASEFFDAAGSLKLDGNGQPLLKTSAQIWEKAKSMPVDQLPSVTKLYDLEPIRACLLFAGTSRIGDITIQNFVESFQAHKEVKKRRSNYTIEWLSNHLKDHVMDIYEKEIKEPWARPGMQILVSGYSAKHDYPEVWKLAFTYKRDTNVFECDVLNPTPRKTFNIIFGGQYDVIQRVVLGIDESSYWSLRGRIVDALSQFYDEMMLSAQVIHPAIAIPKPNFWEDKYNIFRADSGGATRLSSDIGSLSEQAGIDFVRFLIDIMIKAQEFSSSIPTVGGKIHVAILTKSKPFKWLSKEAFQFENEIVPKF